MHNAAYDRLKARFARIAALGEAAGHAALGRQRHDAARAAARRAASSSRPWPALSHELLTAPVVAEDLEIAPRRRPVGRGEPAR